MMEDEEENAEGTDPREVIARFRKFAKASDKRYSSEINDWRKARDFACGDQDSNDYTETRGGSGRMFATANIIPRIIASVANPVRKNPYSVEYVNKGGDQTQQVCDMLNAESKAVNVRSNAASVQYESLIDSLRMGAGAFYLTTVKNTMGTPELTMCSVFDPTMIVYDPNSKEPAGEDSEKTAVVELIGKDLAKREYGEEAAEDWKSPLVGAFGTSWNCDTEEQVQLVTYYERRSDTLEDGTRSRYVMMYKLVGDSVVREVRLDVSRIPVFLIKGNIEWSHNRPVLRGVTQKVQYVQTIINYAESQLGERLARAPKPEFSISKEALEGNESYYKNVDKNMFPLLVYNAFKKDGISPLNPPQRLDNSVQTDDLDKIMGSQRDLAAVILGVESNGGQVQGLGQNETAEGLLLRTKANETDTGHYTDHLQSAMKVYAESLLEMVCIDKGMDATEVKKYVTWQIVNGPDLVTTKQEARRELLAISQLVPDDMKPVIAWGVCETMDNPEIKGLSKMLAKLLPPQVFSDMPQVQQLTQQLQQANQQAQAMLAQKDKAIGDLQQKISELQLRSVADLSIARMNQAGKVEQAKLDAEIQAQAEDRRFAHDIAKDVIAKKLDSGIDNRNY